MPSSCPLSLPQTLLARRYVLPCAWLCFRQILPPQPQQSCLQGVVDFESYRHILHNSIHLFISPPGFKSPLVIFVQTTDFSGSIQQRVRSLNQADPMQLVESTVAPAAVASAATAVFAFTLKVDWNWLAVKLVPELPCAHARWEFAFITLHYIYTYTLILCHLVRHEKQAFNRNI